MNASRRLVAVRAIASCAVFLFGVVGMAQQTKTELLWPDGAPGATGVEDKDKPRLIVHLPERAKSTGVGVVIYPGGGYGHLAMGHEGDAIAKWLNSHGIAGFICDYRHRGKGYGHPAPMQDAQQAIRTVRARAKEFGIETNKIGVIGFSAGGHLASTVATHFEDEQTKAVDEKWGCGCRPDFAILCYPVIAFSEPYTHRGSQNNLLGKDANASLVRKFSNEKQVTSNTPPTFLWHTSADRGVPPENSVQFYLALKRNQVPAELHIYTNGRHGVGLAKNIDGTSDWPKACLRWLQSQKFLATN